MIVYEEVLITNYFLSEVALAMKFFVHFLYTRTTSYQKNQSSLLQEQPPIKKFFLLQEQPCIKKNHYEVILRKKNNSLQELPLTQNYFIPRMTLYRFFLVQDCSCNKNFFLIGGCSCNKKD